MQMETSSDHAAAIVFPHPFPSQTRLEKWHPVGYNSVGDHHFALTSAFKCGSCRESAAVLQYHCSYSVTACFRILHMVLKLLIDYVRRQDS